MKNYTLLRITAIVLEAIGYMFLFGGLILAMLVFGFSFSVLPESMIRFIPSSIVGLIVFIVWIYTFGPILIIAHVIKVCLHSYDNTEKILEIVKLNSANNNTPRFKEDSSSLPKSRQSINDYYANR